MVNKNKSDLKVKNVENTDSSSGEGENDITFFKIEQKRRVGRPLTPNSGFNVTIHKTSNKYRYLSIQRTSPEFRRRLVFPKEVKMNVVEDLERRYNANRSFYDNVVEKEKILEDEFELV